MKATDEMLWEALDIAQLKLVVKSLPGGLGETSVFVHMCVCQLYRICKLFILKDTQRVKCAHPDPNIKQKN